MNKSTAKINLSSDILKSVVAVGHAADACTGNATLAGVLLRVTGDKVHVTATDGKLIATHIYDVNTDIEIEFVIEWNTKDKTAQRLIKLLAKNKAAEHVYEVECIGDSGGKLSALSLTIDGVKIGLVCRDYPDYANAIPARSQCRPSESLAINGKYIALLPKCLVMQKYSQGMLMMQRGKHDGIMFYPLAVDLVCEQRAMIMPMTCQPHIIAKYTE